MFGTAAIALDPHSSYVIELFSALTIFQCADADKFYHLFIFAALVV